MDTYTLEKEIWTHSDFEKMGWHDTKIYGIAIEKNDDNFGADFLLDIDYIFKWVRPALSAGCFTFWVAPCTLIFKNCFDLCIGIETRGAALGFTEMEINDLNLIGVVEQEKNKFVYHWIIDLQGGRIELKSYGFEQIVRHKPIHVQRQSLSLEERGEINFGRKPC